MKKLTYKQKKGYKKLIIISRLGIAAMFFFVCGMTYYLSKNEDVSFTFALASGIIAVVGCLLFAIVEKITLSERMEYSEDIKRERELHWKDIIIEKVKNGEVESAKKLFSSLNFKDISISSWMNGFMYNR